MRHFIVLLFFLLQVCPQIFYGQNAELQAQRLANATKVYEQVFSNQTLLQNGKVYGYFYYNAATRHFVHDPQGNIKYDLASYSELDLYYDLYNDLVFVRNFQGGSQQYIILKQALVETFTLGRKSFVNLQQAPDSLMEKGFHQLAFDKNGIQLYVKKKMILKEVSSRLPGEPKATFTRKDVHYLLMPTGAKIIKRKKDLLMALGKVDELKAFTKKNQILFTPREEAFTDQIVQVLEHFISTQ